MTTETAGGQIRDEQEGAVRLGLAVVLPEVRDLQDACIDRLIQLLESRDGVRRVHVVRAGDTVNTEREDSRRPSLSSDERPLAPDEAALCLHYDPSRLTLGRIRALASSTGAEVTDRYAHAVVTFHLVGAEDAAHHRIALPRIGRSHRRAARRIEPMKLEIHHADPCLACCVTPVGRGVEGDRPRQGKRCGYGRGPKSRAGEDTDQTGLEEIAK